MLKIPRQYDNENTSSTLVGLRDKIWEQQLSAKQILISGVIGEDIIEKAVIQIYNFNMIDSQQESEAPKGVEYERQPITVLINSPGGLIAESFSLISAILSSITPVHTVVLGHADSAAFNILLAGHHRMAQRFSSMMYHQGSGGISDQFAKIHDYSDYVRKLQHKIDMFVLERTKIKEKKLKEVFLTQHNWYITPEEALLLGVIHEII